MYAIVEIAGLQYKVKKDQQLYVNRLQQDTGEMVTFDKVLLTDNGSINVGAPVIEGAAVEAKILEHLKGDKVIVFKKKRRKGYRKKNGFRPSLTKVEITAINTSGKTEKAEKKEAPKKAAPKAESKSKSDDLTLIEGIGPKVQELLNENGIHTFKDLSKKSADEIKAILEPKGGVYAGMDPGTWPAQAEMAAEGKMDELKVWQDELNAGK